MGTRSTISQSYPKKPANSNGNLLWFPSPPVNTLGRLPSQSGAGPSRHSLEYLHWRAMKINKGSMELETTQAATRENKGNSVNH
ncbi:hypothetical protein GYMLUDRAFT_42749 [Collybiopsis luxurians FD-317 M1]|uniref:Uncharacterized protein n=1 Tax=Collybiopsis luxurians FD-317 M1 TaxID=944289 RepID=A0A0D0BDD7_9AGAR|nr:hypothetical protein GYMLUDRAFT_42749 [Collybiopsis luxurians FD-317 M1]